MTILKQFLAYLFWIGVSFIAAFGYIRIILGPEPGTKSGFLAFLYLLIRNAIIVELVPIIGSIIAVLYILTDVFYLKKKLKNNLKGIIIRFISIIVITLAVGVIHYLLEKVIDVI
ncbi:MAG: hypothetical protein COA67_03915 [Lutibacter sp.]|nr:MAG: hypothetical protein COA67_03915 [Lutibacter sp.]